MPITSKRKRHKIMERTMRELMGNNLPPRFKFKDTYDSIEVPAAYQQYLPSQATLEAKFEELETQEEAVEDASIDATIIAKSDSVITSNLEVGTSNLFVDTETGRVGIGTDSPAQKLDVAGRIRADTMEIDSYIYHVGDTDTYFGFDGADHFRIVEGGGTRLQVDSNGRIGIGLTNPASPLHVSASTTSTHTMRITHNDTNATSGTQALFIDANYSGSDTFTGDKANAGLYIDLDSSADGGGLTEEHRIYGIYSDTRHSGDSDLVDGIYSYARSDHTSGTTTNLRAGDFLAVSSGTGINTNIYGIGSIALKDGGSTGTTTRMYGIRGEVEVDAGTCTTAYGVQSHIDRDGGTIGTGYLYYGNYAGTVGTKWGIYLTDETKNYFSGNVGIGEANPQAKLHVNGGITKTQYNPGEVIETLHGRADGTSITVLSGTYTLTNVTAAQNIGTAHTVINGSSISYKPPPGTTRVIYELQVYTRHKDADVLMHLAGRLAGTQVSHSRHTFRSRDYEQQWVYNNMTITIGQVASDNLAAGQLASWTTNKTLDFTARDYTASYEGYLHRTDHWDGAGTDLTVTPVIKITAIA